MIKEEEVDQDATCEYCFQIFKDFDLLNSHIEEQHPNIVLSQNYPVQENVNFLTHSSENEQIESENIDEFYDDEHIGDFLEVEVQEDANQMQNQVQNENVSFENTNFDMTFGNNEELFQHKAIHSNQIRPFICQFCQKQYKDRSSLNRHLLIHGEKKFSCDFCSMKFHRQQGLNSHLKTHGAEPVITQTPPAILDLQCKFCSRKFARNSNLVVHERSHFGKNPKDPQKCEYCPFESKDTNTLKRHLRTHTGEKPYSCRFCQMKFAASARCKEHERCHTGERPYECKTCQKTFTNPKCLKRHEIIHTGLKPYACKFCEKAYTQPNDLRRHVKKNHQSEIQQASDLKIVKVESLVESFAENMS